MFASDLGGNLLGHPEAASRFAGNPRLPVDNRSVLVYNALPELRAAVIRPVIFFAAEPMAERGLESWRQFGILGNSPDPAAGVRREEAAVVCADLRDETGSMFRPISS